MTHYLWFIIYDSLCYDTKIQSYKMLKRYQSRIYQNHMTSVQYLTRVGDVLNIQVEKVYGYDEWLQALDQGNTYVNLVTV